MEEERLRIAATSDVHWPQYQGLFIRSLHQLPSKFDLLLFAGDLVNRGNSHALIPLIEKLKTQKITCPIVSCFGNDEYDSIKDTLRATANDVLTFLEDELKSFTIKGKEITVIGSRGVLDQPTYWQLRNIEGIRETYTKRVETLDRLLTKAKSISPYTVLLTHYAPSFVTLKGERQRAFSQMGSSRVEQLLAKHTPRLAIHGHAHQGLRKAKLGNVRIFNVALPLNRQIAIIKMPL